MTNKFESNVIKAFAGSLGVIDYYMGDNDTIYLNVEQVAIGLGFTTNVKGRSDNSCYATSGITQEYEVIRWNRVNQYLQDYGYPHEVGRGDFIPEQMFYLLAMKAKNEKAKEFQMWIASEVLPNIRRNYKYEFDVLQEQNWSLLEELNHYKRECNTEKLTTTTVLANNFGMTAQALNSFLYYQGVIRPSGQTWVLFESYQNRNWAVNKNGTFYWTEKGVAAVEAILMSTGFRYQNPVEQDNCPFTFVG